jgi:hypothetical protein
LIRPIFAWNRRPNGIVSIAVPRVYFHVQEQKKHTDVFILVNYPGISSPLQAEGDILAQGLIGYSYQHGIPSFPEAQL